MKVTFPLFDLPSIRARKEIEHYHELAEAARYDQVLQDLNGEVEKAKDMLTGARRVARNIPIQLDAARATEQQAQRVTKPVSRPSWKWPKRSACSRRLKSTTPWPGSVYGARCSLWRQPKEICRRIWIT